LSNTRLKEIEQQEETARKTLDENVRAMEKRVGILGVRVRGNGTYSLEEPFAGFETNPMVRQQLLMKNAIQSAMRDGKGFATFPGAESNQPALYVGKVQPNLKQVIKDLGGEKSGLELRQIELPPDKDGNPITATGVVWSPEAAARIMKTGVPFAAGGMVQGYAEGGIADLPKGYDEEDPTTLKPFLPTTTSTANNAGIATIVPNTGNPNAAAAQAASFAKLTPAQLAQHQVQLAMLSDAKPTVVQVMFAIKDAVQNAINNSTATSSGGVSTSSGSPMGGIASKGTVSQAIAANNAIAAAIANAANGGTGSGTGSVGGNAGIGSGATASGVGTGIGSGASSGAGLANGGMIERQFIDNRRYM
jgi:hypothetical protein